MRSIPAQDKADESLALLDRLLGEAQAASPACDPALGPCPAVVDGVPADDTAETGPSLDPDGVVPRSPEPRTTARGGDGDGDGPAADDQATRSGSSDDEPAENRNRDGSGSGGSGGGDAAAGSDDQLSSLSRCRPR